MKEAQRAGERSAAWMWRERNMGGRKKEGRECGALEESDVANKREKVQSKGQPLVYLCLSMSAQAAVDTC